jgi:hypothetical protein
MAGPKATMTVIPDPVSCQFTFICPGKIQRGLSLLRVKRPLLHPIVSCALGKLYNKDAILEYLIDKSAYGDGEKICGHIRSLKVRNRSSTFVYCLPSS